uniref:transcription initiation factor TFIID subunit 8-like n=1 Tax=Erigeron canadensis TaxID=72917 RepID=UPI001CB914E5|nr:transcription initiation factor TFIID subunit 8-like [Erigeron canadensis]
MSHGGEIQLDTSKNRAASDEFGRAIAKVAVTQICERVGFHSFNDSVLDALADIAIRYVKDLGKTAKFYANVANRTECNVFDVIQCLEDMGCSVGFPGGSERCDSLVRSGAVKEIIEYVEVSDEFPFAQPVASFPVVRDIKLMPSFAQMGEVPEFKHVPEWLPAFPDAHTYIHTPVWNERKLDPRSDKIELARQRRKAESSLLNLHKRLLSSGSGETSLIEVGNGSKKSRLIEGDSSLVVLSSDQRVNESNGEKRVPLVEMFAPVVQALNGQVSESGDNGERDFPDKRPAVRLHFNYGRKMIGDSLNLRLWNRGTGRISSWFGRDDVMDDKKRRAEYILRQSMENRLDLSQL